MRLSETASGDYPEHAGIVGYEKRGTSKKYTYYAIPQGCDTIFFPGCTLSGTRPDKVSALYEHMKKTMPALGIVLDCCAKPSHDLGRENYFHTMFHEMKEFLVKNGIRKVIVVCPSCYEVFNKYGDDISVKTAYEFMVQNGLPDTGTLSGTVTIHDSCASRFDESVHTAIRDLVSAKGLTIEEMTHSGVKTFCCGEGGSVGFLAPELSTKWGNLRKKEANGRRMITYCAGCANLLGPLTPTSHVLDLLFEPEATMTGDVTVSKAPFTYWNRLKLKKRLQKTSNGARTRERTFTADGENKKGGMLKRLVFLLLVIAAIAAIRFSGATQYLEQDKLRQLIQGYGALAPVIYMLVYTVAPSLFLPGLPITIAGGILFGPFWGVVYTITSATLGACLAFLISRYIARDWVEKKAEEPEMETARSGSRKAWMEDRRIHPAHPDLPF